MPDWRWSGAVLKEFDAWFALVAELTGDVFGDFG
jgi:hypothetical protein